MEFIILIIFIVVLLLLLSVLAGFIFFVIDLFLMELPYVATRKEKISTIIKLAAIKQDETVIDLGAGDGRLLFKSAKKGAHSIGYELNPYLVFYVLGRSKLNGTSHLVKIYKKNLWHANLKKADVIFVYGRKKTMQKFQNFVYKNAKKGTRLVVNDNPFPTKKSIKVENKVYLYKV